MWGCGEAIENLLKLDEEELHTISFYETKIDNAFRNA
jgi:hypothetical protein